MRKDVKKLRIAIVDDYKEDRTTIFHLLDEYMKQYNLDYDVSFYDSAEAFLADFDIGKFQLVFMDIYMKEVTGMDAAKQIYDLDSLCRIIFITSSQEYLRQSYHVRAVYYLIKPVVKEEFLQAMSFCQLKPDYEVPILTLTSNRVDYEIPTEQILYIDVYQHTTIVHFTDHTLELYMSLNRIWDILQKDKRFLTCARGIVINFQHVNGVENEYLLMSNGEKVYFSKRNKKKIKTAWEKYMYTRMVNET